MAGKGKQLSTEMREAIFEAARAGAFDAYGNTGGTYINYFKATETLLFNFRKISKLLENEEEYCAVEYHSGKKSFSYTPTQTGYVARKTEEELAEDMREEKRKQYQETKSGFERLKRTLALFENEPEFVVIRLYYFGENIDGTPRKEPGKPTWETVAALMEESGTARDPRTLRKWRNKLVNDISVCVFGLPAAIGAGTYREAPEK